MDKKKPAYFCSEIERIVQMETTLKGLCKTINGNGKDGIADCVIRLDENVKSLTGWMDEFKKDFSDIRKSYSALAIAQSEINAEKKVKMDNEDRSHRNKVHIRWLYFTGAGLVLTVAVLVFQLLGLL